MTIKHVTETYATNLSIFLSKDMDVTNSTVNWTLGVPQWTTDTAFKQKTIAAPVYIMWRPFNRFLSYSLTWSNNVLRS